MQIQDLPSIPEQPIAAPAMAALVLTRGAVHPWTGYITDSSVLEQFALFSLPS
jgi:hypothetical protein